MKRTITRSSNKTKNKSMLDRQNKMKMLTKSRLSKSSEKEIVFDSKLPNHTVKGNRSWTSKTNTTFALSMANPDSEPFKCSEQGINDVNETKE